MEVILMRHAETAGNLEKRYIGATDEPLCPAGMRSAIMSGIMTYVPLVYASTQIRAVQTATLKFPYARVVCVPGLREMDFGAFERRTADEMAGDAAYREWVDGECAGRCPQGEDKARFAARVCVAFSEVVAENLRRGFGSVIIVAHGGTIMAIMERFAQPYRPYFDWHAPHCGGYRATLDDDTWPRSPILTEVMRL